MVLFKRGKEEPPTPPEVKKGGPEVKKEDQEYFEDDKVKEVPAEPYKSEQGWVQKDEQGEVTEKLHLLRILEMIYIFKCKL